MKRGILREIQLEADSFPGRLFISCSWKNFGTATWPVRKVAGMVVCSIGEKISPGQIRYVGGAR